MNCDNTLIADKCFGEYQGGCPVLRNRLCAESRALSRSCGACLPGYQEITTPDECLREIICFYNTVY